MIPQRRRARAIAATHAGQRPGLVLLAVASLGLALLIAGQARADDGCDGAAPAAAPAAATTGTTS